MHVPTSGPANVPLTAAGALRLWRGALAGSLGMGPDLSTRQMAILLSVYLEPGAHTVRGLAGGLGISKAAVCRALDALAARDLVRRKRDADDGRNVLVQRTVAGSVFLRDFGDQIVAAATRA